jgi:ABC-type antimicrobial peptide transport system permease subunit
VVDRRARARALETDPVALGISGALTLGFVAAAVFAVVGFAVSAAVVTRERATEFAVLRSLGVSTRQVSGSLALESAITVVLSLAGGILLGVLLAWFVLPYVSLTGAGERAFPSAIVEMPWLTAVWLVLGLLAALLVVVVAQVRLLGRVRLAPALRLGEDR